MKKGYIQIYTGNGKGKTTAALGQALRAAGAGLKTYIIQFMKEFPYNELISAQYLSDFITIEQVCKDDFVYKRELPSEEEVAKAKNALSRSIDIMRSGKYDIVILDEVCVSTYFKLLKTEDIIPVLDAKPDSVELILTGRYCPGELIEKADLVTEMKEIKHYYTQGVKTRSGIES